MEWKIPNYVFLGLMLGIVPPLVSLRLPQHYQPTAIEEQKTMVPRAVQPDEKGYFKMFDQPNQRNPPSSNARTAHNNHLRNSKRHQGPLEALSSIKALGFTKKMFVALLSTESREKKMAAAVGMTWGSDVIDFKFMYARREETVSESSSRKHHQDDTPVMVTEAYGEDHTMESLFHICHKLPDHYRWYMVTKDTMYIDTEETLKFLDTLYHGDSLVLGKNNGGQCSLDQGVILSRHAHQKLCENIQKCSTGGDQTIGECIALATETKCTDLAKASGTVYISEDELQNIATIKLNEQVLAYPGMETPQDMYQLHLQKIDMKISETAQKLSTLRNSLEGKSTKREPAKPALFLNDWEGKLDTKTLNSTRPSHQMIDSNGAIVRTGCKNLNTVKSGPYMSAKRYADNMVETTERDLKTFGYRRDVTAFQMVHEFYYTSPKMGRQHVNYVTVSQNYSVLNMLSSEVYSMKNFSMFTTVFTSAEARELDQYLDHVQQACSDLSAFKVNCEVFVVVNESSTSNINISQIKSVLNNFIIYQQSSDLPAISVKLIHIDANKSSDVFLLADVAPGNTVAYSTIHSVFDHEYLLRCHINSQPLKTVYSPIPFQLYKSDSQHRTEYSASSGHWLSSDYKTFCVSQNTILGLSLKFLDIKNGLSHPDTDLLVNRYPDPGLSRLPLYSM